MTNKQERPEGTIATQEASYVGISVGGKTTEIISGNPSNLYINASNGEKATINYVDSAGATHQICPNESKIFILR